MTGDPLFTPDLLSSIGIPFRFTVMKNCEFPCEKGERGFKRSSAEQAAFRAEVRKSLKSAENTQALG